MVKTMMIPEAIDVSGSSKRAMLYAYCNSVMEPWDGPAAIAAYANNWVIAGLDRNGLRPMRYVVTSDGLVIAGSETGMVVVPDAKILERGGLGPGEMIGINLAEGNLYRDDELKDALAEQRDY
jgi:glutamate synthase (NADPH/NADH) large chain